ncbi:PAT complex subunit CCDC47 [Coccinella septempunctata]|uniref:PAT complex subunit CCDC47 n=1 Tax=Coccinella septempunctata TaxID=41139 RepID=UPI001D07E3E9|nr:PAT complex subunit CCDC47 [Coccinella septempunctata]
MLWSKMKLKVSILLLFCLVNVAITSNFDDVSDNDFAEFENFEAEDEAVVENEDPVVEISTEKIKAATFLEEDEQEAVVDNDESEFEHFNDVEEFEGFEEVKEEKVASSEPKITITNVPIHLRANWDSYWLEILMIAGLVVYFINFAMGKSKNNKIANVWLQTHRTILEDNFSLVGDDPSSLERGEQAGMIKESENVFTLWCSGRTCCEGMLVELKLIKRQDLVAIMAGIVRPVIDQIHIKVTMNKEDMDSFVFCVASKKTALHLSKDMADISTFCPDRRLGEKFNIPPNFNVMSEIAEATSSILDSKITAVLNKYGDMVDYIHFSDQFTGPKQTEENASLKLPETEKVLLFGFNLKLKGKSLESAMKELEPLMVMVFYCIEKIKRYRLSKEGKTKADKNRQRVEELFLKSTHQARAEAAAAKREEKRRQEKERIMAEEDPERQRRWEEKENKRQAKKRAPKMKQLKVKAM